MADNQDKYEDQLQKITEQLQGEISTDELSRLIRTEALKYISKNFNTKKGAFDLDADAIKGLKSFNTELKKAIINSANYQKSVLNFLNRFRNIHGESEGFLKEAGTPVSKNDIKPEQQIIIDELIRSFEDTGIQKDILDPIREELKNKILARDKVSAFESALSTIIPAATGNYTKNSAITAADSYQAVINKKVYDKYKNKITHIRVVNTLIKTSSPQCIKAVRDYKGEVPLSAWPQIFRIAKENGLIPGTTLENLAVNRLHYRCRHQFYPIIKV